MKNAVTAIGVIVLIVIAFWGGTVYASADPSLAMLPGDGLPASGGMRGGGLSGGPFADLTEEQMAEVQNMTPEERQEFFAEQGIEGPTGAAGGMRGGLIEGEVLEVSTDTFTVALTDGGSQTIYIDDDSIIGFADDAPDFGVGAQVMAFAQPEADGVTIADAVLVF